MIIGFPITPDFYVTKSIFPPLNWGEPAESMSVKISFPVFEVSLCNKEWTLIRVGKENLLELKHSLKKLQE